MSGLREFADSQPKVRAPGLVLLVTHWHGMELTTGSTRWSCCRDRYSATSNKGAGKMSRCRRLLWISVVQVIRIVYWAAVKPIGG